MAPLAYDILVLSPAEHVRTDLASRVARLTIGTVTAAATVKDALARLTGGRHIILADATAPDLATMPARLAAAVIAPVATDLELGVALGRAAERAASPSTSTDAEREMEELASLLPDTAALLFGADRICQVARGALATRAHFAGLKLEGRSAEQLAGPGWETSRPHWEAALRGERRQYDYAHEETGRTYATDLIPRLEGERVAGVVCVVADVTAQRRAEAAEAAARDELARNEAWYRAMVDHLHEGVSLRRADGTWLANESAYRILGLTPAQLAGEEPPPEGWAPIDADGAPIALRDLPVHETRRTGRAITDRIMGMRWPDGTTRWRLVSTKAIPSITHPGARDVVSSLMDVTAQREAERALAREHAELNEAQALARVGSWRVQLPQRTWTWSDELCRIFGRTPGHPPADLAEFIAHVHPDDRGLLARMWSERSTGPFELYFRLRHRTGGIAFLHLRAHAERDADGRAIAMAGVVQDVTERQEVEIALRAAQRRFEAAFDEAPIGMTLMDADGRNVRVNRAICDLTGRSHAELLRMRHGALDGGTPEADDLRALGDLLSGRVQHWTTERRLTAADGRAMWVQISAARLQATPDEPPMILCHFLDISHRHRLERRLRHLAEHDPLTGVPNRRAWEAQVPQAIEEAERTGAPLGLALLDLNDFKAVNDTLGHDAGDRVLREVAAAWRSQLRDSDLLARLGGDEFAVLLPDCGEDDLQELARRLRTSLHYEAGCSVGAVTWHPGECADELVRRADAALYRDKVTPLG